MNSQQFRAIQDISHIHTLFQLRTKIYEQSRKKINGSHRAAMLLLHKIHACMHCFS